CAFPFVCITFVFVFSSRRRHTRSKRDWSSDVCSSDLIGEISFISQSVAPILQLAVSLDYAIFLLHRFQDFRQETDDPTEAMKRAIKKSFPAITASAATTFFGFMALTFMNFEIVADLGMNLVKGILLSFLSVDRKSTRL